MELDVETAVVVDETLVLQPPVDARDDAIDFHTIPGTELAAALIYEGRYADIQPAILELLRWVGTHQHTPVGPLRELHLSGPAHVNGLPVESAIVELQLPIARMNQSD